MLNVSGLLSYSRKKLDILEINVRKNNFQYSTSYESMLN